MKIKRAIITVTDKSYLDILGPGLKEYGVEILSTGGTASHLRGLGVPVVDVAEYTHFPECLGGRLKTIHPRIAGGILGRDNSRDLVEMEENGLQFIGLVVVNLYPFEATIERPGVKIEQAIEQIDIGGPCLIRAAAKNHERVTVVTHPSDYEQVLREMAENNGDTTLATRRRLAREAFKLTARYDLAIYNYLEEQGF